MSIQILKLLWNRRKDYIWIFLEQILVFIVLLFCFVQSITKLQQYLDPGNLSMKNVSMVAIIPNNNGMDDSDWEDFEKKSEMIHQRMISAGLVEAIHEGYYSVPLNRPAEYNFQDSLIYNGKKYKFYIKTSDDKFPQVFKPRMISGTWYKNEAFGDGVYPAVVTKTLVEELGISEPIGMRLSYQGRDFRVTGVMPDFKTRVYDDATPTAIFASAAFSGHKFENNAEMAILVKEGQMNNFITQFWKEAMTAFPNEGHQPIASDMEDINKMSNIDTYLILMSIAIPTLFLIVFAFLGTFSLMYRQSQKMTGEYGLRMALGSTKSGLKQFVLSQSFILTGIAILIGCFIAVNLYITVFPEIEILSFLIAVLGTVLLMLLFALISVWYPAHLASKIQPAIALKQEE